MRRTKKVSNQRSDFIRRNVQRKMTGVENMHLGVRHIFAIALRLARVEREIILAPANPQARLLLAHPRLPLGIGIDIGAILVEQIALNLRFPRLSQKSELVRPPSRSVPSEVRPG